VAKRTGKTHENLENELTPPPAAPRPVVGEPARTRSSVARPPRADRSGPIGISGGDFATPSARKRTTTQPRGMSVVGGPPPAAKNGTPPPVARDGAQPESPFAAPAPQDFADAASRLAAEAAAVRALDSGPLTPPPALDDPGPTPPPVATSAPASVAADAPTPPPALSAPPAPVEIAEPAVAAPIVANAGANAGVGVDVASEVDVATEDRFSAQETPWPELAQQTATLRGATTPTPTPTPGSIPTDAMGGDSGPGIRAAEPALVAPLAAPAEPAVAEPEPVAAELTPARVEDAESAPSEDLDLDGAETLDALPAEALADAGPVPPIASEASPPSPPPAPRAAPPPIPAGSPRRKTGEMRAPEVPTAQVVASIVPAIPSGGAALPEALAQRPRRPKRSKPWFEEVFDEDYLRTLPFMSADQTLREVEFIEESLGVKPGGQVLDVGCGYGRHAIELVQRGLDVTGLDLSLPLLLRAADEAQTRAMSVNFVHADMREMAFDKQFDGVYAMLTSFGYFDEETNLKVAEGIARALKPGGRLLLDLVNRDYVVSDLPSRVWWEGNGCVVLEEVDFNFHTSRILTHRSIVFEDGRQIEQEISVRAYSLHEIGRLLRQAGFRVLDVSGSLATRGHFFGATSRNLFILAEKRLEET
jgi:SAM-dependent methyltransferase